MNDRLDDPHEGTASTITLHARGPITAPLADELVRNMVLATAHAIGERQGIELLIARAEDSSITVTLRCGRIEALGFIAELRRLTESWHQHKFGASLWGGSLE